MTSFRTLSGVTLTVVAVWAIVFGVAWLSRVAGGWSARSSAAIITASYLCLVALDFSWFGFDTNGYLGAIGMLLPCAAAIGIVVIGPRKPRAEQRRGPGPDVPVQN